MGSSTNLFHPVKLCVCFTSAADGPYSERQMGEVTKNTVDSEVEQATYFYHLH